MSPPNKKPEYGHTLQHKHLPYNSQVLLTSVKMLDIFGQIYGRQPNVSLRFVRTIASLAAADDLLAPICCTAQHPPQYTRGYQLEQ
jgi:hypothetical protein